MISGTSSHPTGLKVGPTGLKVGEEVAVALAIRVDEHLSGGTPHLPTLKTTTTIYSAR